MTDTEIIIIGAGASGLVAALEQSRHGNKVIILEARDRLGGRIHTLDEADFPAPVEAGAEFIHGNLPVTMALLRQAGISYHPIAGDTWRVVNRKWEQEDFFPEEGDLLVERLQQLKEDTSVGDFLNRHFKEARYDALREAVTGYVEGYDAGDLYKASAFALRDDWTGLGFEDQYRPDGGYTRLINYLEQECKAAGCQIYRSAVVKEAQWQPGHVTIVTAGGQQYTASKALITVPLGVLQATPGSTGAVAFSPALPHAHAAAIRSLGFGNIIKILLQFGTAFWKEAPLHRRLGQEVNNLGWLFSGAPVPTWWTQLPEDSPLLTGWVGGSKAAALMQLDEEAIAARAIASLAELFGMDLPLLKERLAAFRVVNWPADPFTRGAYSYTTVETTAALQVLARPVHGTLFFAGEALHEGPQMGTVEGALASGIKVASMMKG